MFGNWFKPKAVLSKNGRCGMCGRRLDQANDPLSGDCGGDCWGCIGEVEAGMGWDASVEAVRREIREEAGIECDELALRGTISWPGFGKHGEDWLGFVFVITAYSGTPFERNPEGTLEWVPVEKIMTLPLWDGDRHFLPLVFDNDPRGFHGVMPYRDGRMVSWDYSRI